MLKPFLHRSCQLGREKGEQFAIHFPSAMFKALALGLRIADLDRDATKTLKPGVLA
jgi:hypothetical protein